MQGEAEASLTLAAKRYFQRHPDFAPILRGKNRQFLSAGYQFVHTLRSERDRVALQAPRRFFSNTLSVDEQIAYCKGVRIDTKQDRCRLKDSSRPRNCCCLGMMKRRRRLKYERLQPRHTDQAVHAGAIPDPIAISCSGRISNRPAFATGTMQWDSERFASWEALKDGNVEMGLDTEFPDQTAEPRIKLRKLFITGNGHIRRFCRVCLFRCRSRWRSCLGVHHVRGQQTSTCQPRNRGGMDEFHCGATGTFVGGAGTRRSRNR